MKFDKDIAKSTVKKSLSLPKEENEVSPLYRHYFDLKTGEPIPLDRRSNREYKLSPKALQAYFYSTYSNFDQAPIKLIF